MNQADIHTLIPLPVAGGSEGTDTLPGCVQIGRLARIMGAVAMISVLVLVFTCGIGAMYFDLRAGSYDLSRLEEDEVGSRVIDLEGRLQGELFSQDRAPVQTGDYPPLLVEALTATEDARFFDHGGFDATGILRAAAMNVSSGRIRQGGSTITQQLARITFGLKGRTLDRKLTELFLAARIESIHDKDSILALYVNRVYVGSGFWGLGAASLGYFGKELRDLSVSEVALLCAIIKRPSSYSPLASPELALAARNRTVERMARLGYLTTEEAAELCGLPLGIVSPDQRAPRPDLALHPILDEAKALLAGRPEGIKGVTIQTSVDVVLQDAARQSLERVLSGIEGRPDYGHPVAAGSRSECLQGAVIVIDNQTGAIVAQVGGREGTNSEFDRSVWGRRPAGAAFLPIVYAAAFESPGFSPTSLVIDAPMNNRLVMIGGMSGILGEWSTEQAGGFYEGEIPAGYALLRSKNAAAVRVGTAAGLDRVILLATAAGIRSRLRNYPATFLGSSEVGLLELTRAYTMFPTLGRKPRPSGLVERIQSEEGDVLYARPEEEEYRTLSVVSAAQVTAILSASLRDGGARDLHGLRLDHAAGQGGTAYDFTDCWFVGFNTRYTCGVWVGFDLPKPIYHQAFSHEVALPIWVDVMNALPGSDVPLPALVENRVEFELCLRSGGLATDSCRNMHPALICKVPLEGEERPSFRTCEVHGDASLRSRAGTDPVTSVPGAVPVHPLSPVVVGDNPYELLP